MRYLDASVVIAYYLVETYSDRVQHVYMESAELLCSDLAELEFCSTLSRLVRVGSLETESARRVLSRFETHLHAGLYVRLYLEPEHFRWARSAIARLDLPLKAPDALHLAAAQRDGLMLVTADRQLARNAEALGVAVDLIAP